MFFAGVRARRHGNQTQYSHQTLHALSVYSVPLGVEPDYHFPAAVKWMAGIFLIQQTQQYQFVFIRDHRLARIDR